MRNVNCPNCQKQLGVPDTNTDLKVRCKTCKHIFMVSSGPKDESSSAFMGIGRPASVGLGIFGIVAAGLLVYVVMIFTPQPRGSESSVSADIGPPIESVKAEQVAVETEPMNDDTGESIGTLRERDIPDQFISTEVADASAASVHRNEIEDSTSRGDISTVMTPEELFASASPAVVRVVARDKDFKTIGMGSGFFVSSDGLLVTNFHVIEGADFATVLLIDGTSLFVNGVLASDAQGDLALLKVNESKLPFLNLSKKELPNVGMKVYAIGNPKGLTNTFSEGIVSGLRESAEGNAMIQTTAAVSPGSSGGPLLGSQGEVIGVTTSYLSEGQNLNFAIAASDIYQLIANRGQPISLASAGGKRITKNAMRELHEVWNAID